MGFTACQKISTADVLSGLFACVNSAFSTTFIIALNALFTDWLASFQANRASTASVQAVCLGVTLGGGLAAGVLIRKLGERTSILLGSFLATAGFFAGAFAPSLPTLVATVGIMAGTGFCLLKLSTMTSALRRFQSKRAFLSSAIACSSGLLNLVSPLFYRYLSDRYTWRGCLILVSGLVLQTAVFGSLLTSPILLSPQPPAPLNHHPAHQAADDAETAGVVPAAVETGSDGTVAAETADLICVAKESADRDFGQSGTTSDNDDALQPLVTTSGETSRGSESRRGDDSSEESKTAVARDDTADTAGTEHRSDGSTRVSSEFHRHLKARAETQEQDSQPDEAKLLPQRDRNLGSDIRFQSESETVQLGKALKVEDGGVSGESSPGRSVNGRCLRWKRDSRFLKNPLYITSLLSAVLNMGTSICFVFLVLDFAANRGWSIRDGIVLNFAFMLSSLIGRGVLGLVSLHDDVNDVVLLGISGLIGSVGLGLVGQVSSFYLAAALYASMGFGAAGGIVMLAPVVLQVTGSRVYPIALGLCFTVEGLVSVVAGVVTGTLVDLLQSYSVVSFVYGVISFVASSSLLIVFIVSYKRTTAHQ